MYSRFLRRLATRRKVPMPLCHDPLVTLLTSFKFNTGARQKNYSGTLEDTFTQIANAGTNGCGFEQHIEAVKRALNNNPANAGFLRPTAYLAVILILDEDD